jgi:formylglycine-generating enzyme required for sulfatase activity
VFEAGAANTGESHINQTTAVGLFPRGQSPNGLLDCAGNVWEWTQSKFAKYPYRLDDGREELTGGKIRVLRGGSWGYGASLARCAYRGRGTPVNRDFESGFRCVLRFS